jgi:hypothetical protein
MTFGIASKQRCAHAVGLDSVSDRPAACGHVAASNCDECGVSLCEDHEILCHNCSSVTCVDCEHACSINSEDQLLVAA